MEVFNTRSLSIEEIILLDFLITNDHFSNNEPIHPKLPSRNIEIYKTRKTITEALDLLSTRGLINVDFSEAGIGYYISNLGCIFNKYLASSYASKLKKAASFMYEKIHNYTIFDLKNYINEQSWDTDILLIT